LKGVFKMANKKIIWGMLGVVLIFGLVLTGCASVPQTSGLMDGNKPVQVISKINGDSSKTGTLSSKVWLGFFGTISFPTIADTAKAGGITKIATVEYYKRPGILGLWTEYITIVTGE
jgi:hypothetical protein